MNEVVTVYKIFMTCLGIIGVYYAIKLLSIRKDLIVKALANPDPLYTDFYLIFFAGLICFFHGIFGVFYRSPEEILYSTTGIASAILYVLVCIRLARRFAKW